MAAEFLPRVRPFWRRLTPLDRLALAVILLYALVWVVGSVGNEVPLAGFIGFLFFLSLGYFLVRLIAWGRGRLLWSLRNRLIVAYVFIAVVPVLLLLIMVGLSAYIIYSQLGAYLLDQDIQKYVEKVADAANHIATQTMPGAQPAAPESARRSTADADLPGLQIQMNTGQELLERHARTTAGRFAGIVQSGEKLSLMAVVSRRSSGGRMLVTASVPLTSELLENMAPYLGPIQLVVTTPATPAESRQALYHVGNRTYKPATRIATRRRTLQPPATLLDPKIGGGAKLEAVPLGATAGEDDTRPVFAFFTARPSQLNSRLFSSLGELGRIYFEVLLAVGVIFLLLEVGALVTGIVLTRTITNAVADLYRATQYVQKGDLTHRVRVQRNDQLGELGESFNSMTGSISTLIEEQRQRQRLENELSIAREVQAQLFPRVLPSLPGIELQAICRAARMVSGDYYDFVTLGSTRLAIAIADISGKGISAALLMASLQATLRSQVMQDGNSSESTAALVTRLNRHLFLNTAEDRYATLFYAVYDTASHMLRYTNAGHLPPFCINGDRVTRLEAGGTVVGLIDDCSYEEGVIQISPGSVLLAYSDGLTEPENVYGEEFGSRRLIDVAMRHRDAAPRVLAETLMTAAEEWAGSPEQADDMTILVARMS